MNNAGNCSGTFHGTPGEVSHEEEKDFFVRIFRQLSAYQDPYRPILGILKDTCEFFGFYSGFVYEADHAGVFHLCEQYVCQGELSKQQFHLSNYLNEEDIEELVKRTDDIVYLNSRKTRLGSKLLELFSAKTLVMAPVIFEQKTPIAFVGLMDRRHPIRLSKQAINNADAVLSVLAGHIKTRVYQRRLEYAHQSMKNIVNNSGLDIYVIDFHSRKIIFANDTTAVRAGGMDKVIGKFCWQIFPCGDETPCSSCPRDKLIDDERNPSGVCTWDYQNRQSGSWYRSINAITRWVDGRLALVVSIMDITENKNNEELIRKMAENDTLTSLPNRRKFMADFRESLERMGKNGSSGYLLFMDLDDFKKTNDTLGHLAGDALLCSIGEFLFGERENLGMPYRYGGDEFVILAENKSPADLPQIRDTLLRRFGAKWELGEHRFPCGISIGAVAIPQGNMTVEEFIQKADATMYEVKRSGKHGFREFNKNLDK
ncbi:hypothetical protein AGMMS49546_17180 [Spirochaetia bacterium]|nr:hypothetical protein AGMMS49546_17180 [Spirochaetia bacterium]